MTALSRILALTDFSEPGDHAVAQAVHLAAQAGAALRVFHAEVPYEGDDDHATNRRSQYTTLARDAGLDCSDPERFDLAIRRNVGVLDAVELEVQEWKPDLVVMGTHGRTGIGRLVLGSVAEKVLRHIQASILVVPHRAAVQPDLRAGPIAVAIDLEGPSRRAVELARSLCEDAALHFVHVIETPLHPSYYAAGITRPSQVDPDLPTRVRAHCEQWLDLEGARVIVAEGQVPDEIQSAVRQIAARVLFVGTHARRGLDHMLLGSVAERVVRGSEVPVFVVR